LRFGGSNIVFKYSLDFQFGLFLFFSVAEPVVEFLVGVTDGVPDGEEGGVVSDVFGVVEGVVGVVGSERKKVERRARELVTRMAFSSLEHSNDVVGEDSHHMAVSTQDQRSADGSEDVAEDVLKGMSVLGGDSNRNHVLVMDLVDVFVQEGGVQQSVGERERDVFTHGEEHHRARERERPWDLVGLHGPGVLLA